MKKSRWIIGFTAVWLVASASPAWAQFWPGNAFGYGGFGGYPIGSFNTTRNIAQQNYENGQVAAFEQNATMQRNIQNTLSNQAVARTNEIENRRSSNRDWWFQVQEQQMAQQRARPPVSPMSGSVSVARDPNAVASRDPAVSTDIIPWLPLLQDPQFAELRAKIEAPYRRTPPKLSAPTPSDYRDIDKAVEQMKAILSGLTASVSAQQYLQAQAFLDQMGKEARERSDAGESKPDAKPVTDTPAAQPQ
jgi:hypothetical protein